MSNLTDKYLKSHINPTNLIFDRENLQLYIKYNDGWFLDVHLQNNKNRNTINISIEAGHNLEDGIRQLIVDLIERITWGEEDEIS